jgi:6-phosphogluconolactonase
MKKEPFIFPSKEKLAENLGDEIIDYTTKLAANQKSVHIALSGGSTPKSLFQYLATHYASHPVWQKTRFFWVDERCVPHHSEESNYGEAKKHFFSHINIPEKNIFPVDGENDPATEAISYSKQVIKHVPVVNHVPRFDIILLGMGEDGHTASIFPGSIALFNHPDFFTSARHPDSGQMRVTMTGKLINHARRVIFHVTGKNKASIVVQILHHKENRKNYPASYVNSIDSGVEWWFDEEAAISL